MAERKNKELDVALAERLRQDDQLALKEVMERFNKVTRHRLKVHFDAHLTETDLDDVLSTAAFRLWNYRRRYDAKKGSLGN